MSIADLRLMAAATTTPDPAAGAVAPLPVVRITPSPRWPAPDLGEVWAYRELLYFFIWRDIKVRYKQTVLGAAWAILQPVLTAVVFTLFFGRLAKIPSDGLPYSLFALTALVPWTFFASAVSQGANSLVSYPNLVKKVYFPRSCLPLARVLACLVDFALAFLVLLGLLLLYGIRPGPEVLWLPALLLLTLVSALGVSFWLAAMNAQFRDVQHVLPFLVQIWMFASPIAYPSSLLPEGWRVVYGLNPMVGVVEGFRWALLGADTDPRPLLLASSAVAIALLVTGALYFRRSEKTFADVL